MIFMGIDASLTSTGICILNEQAKILAHTTIDPGIRRGPERLNYIEQVLRAVINANMPKEVAIEGYSFGSVSQKARIGELGGVIRLLLYRLNIPYVEVAPLTLKKFITGKGAGDKNLILLGVFKKWGVECSSDDLADAYGLARLLHRARIPCGSVPLTYEIEVFKKVFDVKNNSKFNK